MARRKITKFSALVGMIAVTALLMLYFLAVPAFWQTAAGKVFSLLWLIVALVTMVAFGEKVFERKSNHALAPVYIFRGSRHAAPRFSKGPRQKGAS